MADGVDPVVSVVIPARDAAATLSLCLGALDAQSLPRTDYETIVVCDSRSKDETSKIARESGATVLIQADHGAGGARNQGITAARGRWIAFTDADCIPARRWLEALLGAVEDGALGGAGATFGYKSTSPAARYVDITGGLRADKHLAHQRYPWAPTSNVMYSRAALLAVGGFDLRFDSYEGADLHTRLVRSVGGRFPYVPHAVVFHRHRPDWRSYWRQQVNYGRGYAQFFLRYGDELRWSARDEARAWLGLASGAVHALIPRGGDAGLVRRGALVKALAQRRGFASTYWRPGEAKRWRMANDVGTEPTG